MNTPALSSFAPQGDSYTALMQSLAEDRFSHATLLTGIRGIGKRTLSRCIAQYLLCKGEKKPCGVCPGCQQVLSGNHPDLIFVTTPKDKKTIQVDQIRELIAACSLSAYEGGKRVIILSPADAMNPNAQNALLKSLEEPAAENYFILTAESTAALLPTVISRCRRIALHPWSDGVLRKVLQEAGTAQEHTDQILSLCGGSIGEALALSADNTRWERRDRVMQDFFGDLSRSELLAAASRWKKPAKSDAETAEPEEEQPQRKKAKKAPQPDPSVELLEDLESMIHLLVRVRTGQLPESAAAAFPPRWRRMAREADLTVFLGLEDLVRACRMDQSVNVTWQALVEKLLLAMMEEAEKW